MSWKIFILPKDQTSDPWITNMMLSLLTLLGQLTSAMSKYCSMKNQICEAVSISKNWKPPGVIYGIGSPSSLENIPKKKYQRSQSQKKITASYVYTIQQSKLYKPTNISYLILFLSILKMKFLKQNK